MDWQKIFSKLMSYRRAPQLIFGMSPESDWKIIFVSTLFLIVVVIAVSAGIFIKVNKWEIFVVEKTVDSSENTLNIELLEKTVKYYQDKEIIFEEIKSGGSVTVDPSL